MLPALDALLVMPGAVAAGAVTLLVCLFVEYFRGVVDEDVERDNLPMRNV
jgi:hypothetical protein